jgi:hypothetical protein
MIKRKTIPDQMDTTTDNSPTAKRIKESKEKETNEEHTTTTTTTMEVTTTPTTPTAELGIQAGVIEIGQNLEESDSDMKIRLDCGQGLVVQRISNSDIILSSPDAVPTINSGPALTKEARVSSHTLRADYHPECEDAAGWTIVGNRVTMIVADGIGGWKDHGISAGPYACALVDALPNAAKNQDTKNQEAKEHGVKELDAKVNYDISAAAVVNSSTPPAGILRLLQRKS